MARGWYRQNDFPQNEVLYDKLGAKGYLHWLHGLGVRFVVLARGTPDYSSRREAKLVRSGRAGLWPVFRTHKLTIYAVPDPRPIITGPGSPTLTSLTASHIGIVVHAAAPTGSRFAGLRTGAPRSAASPRAATG